jgi:hypothetical protein
MTRKKNGERLEPCAFMLTRRAPTGFTTKEIPQRCNYETGEAEIQKKAEKRCFMSLSSALVVSR